MSQRAFALFRAVEGDTWMQSNEEIAAVAATAAYCPKNRMLVMAIGDRMVFGVLSHPTRAWEGDLGVSGTIAIKTTNTPTLITFFVNFIAKRHDQTLRVAVCVE